MLLQLNTQQITNFLESQQLSESFRLELLTEAENLNRKLNAALATAPDVDAYQQLLITAVAATMDLNQENEILEVIVGLWAQSRPLSKAIDEFYHDFELYRWWSLLHTLAASSEVNPKWVSNMRAILRRYQLLPQWWQWLCQLDGALLATTYSF